MDQSTVKAMLLLAIQLLVVAFVMASCYEDQGGGDQGLDDGQYYSEVK